MRIQTTAGQLNAALRQMTGVVGRRATIPVLSTVKFEGGRLIGTSLDIEAAVTLPTIGDADGAAVIDFFGLSALAAHIDAAEPVTIAEADGIATVTFNGSEYQMASLPISDFPDFGEVGGVRSASGNLGLVAAIRRIRFAMSTEEIRYYLNGVAILNSPDGQPVIAATDGHRLAYMPLDGAPEAAFGAIIQKDSAQLLARQKAEPTAISFNRERPRSSFEFPGMTLSAKLIDGTYPDIFRVIPREVRRVFSVDRRAFLAVAKRMRSFAQSYRGVKLVGRPDGLLLTLSASGNRATEHVAWHGDAPEPFECGYRIDYLVEALSELRGDVVNFSAAEGLAGAPALLTSEGDPLRIVQMPMRV